jgi:pimeloyl-ACP methyl ester carboxylesterase
MMPPAGIEAAGGGPALLVGHAFGQAVARMVAATHPSIVRAVVMLAAGGKVVLSEPAVSAAFRDVFDESLSPMRHLEAVRVAFFAPGNDPSVWRGGSNVPTTKMQIAAYRAASVDDWWSAGGHVPILVIQGLQDRATPPENGRLLKAEAQIGLNSLNLTGRAMRCSRKNPWKSPGQ